MSEDEIRVVAANEAERLTAHYGNLRGHIGARKATVIAREIHEAVRVLCAAGYVIVPRGETVAQTVAEGVEK